jgi:hypothetical protein
VGGPPASAIRASLLARGGLGAAAPRPAGSIRPGAAGGAEPVHLGPGGGQVPVGPGGPLAEFGAGFLEDLGAGVECLAQFVALAGGVSAGLGKGVERQRNGGCR